MWQRRNYTNERASKFFYVSLSHNSLANMYYTNFALMQHHKYSLTELEEMMPFERDIYLEMLQDHLKKLEEQRNG